MKRKCNLKWSYLSLLIVGVGMFMTACSGNDDDQEPVKPHEDVVLDADTLLVKGDYTVKFQLLNANNQPVTTFKEGENFNFALSIINSGNDNKEISLDDFLKMNFFPIYADGTSIGKPYDMIVQSGIGVIRLAPKESFAITCSAFGKRDDETDHGSSLQKIMLVKTSDRDLLPKGNYYTEFMLKIGDGGSDADDVTLRKSFTIVGQ